MKLLVFGEDSPGSLLASLLPGLSAAANVTVINPTASLSTLIDTSGPFVIARRRVASLQIGPIFIEAVRQLQPDVALVIKGRGLRPDHLTKASSDGVRIAIFYPDNPSSALR